MATTFTPDAQQRVAEYPPTSPRKLISGVLVTDGNDGASAGDIAASLFGLTVIESAQPLTKSDNTIGVVVFPSYDGTSLLGKAAATAAAADIPSGTYKAVIRGY